MSPEIIASLIGTIIVGIIGIFNLLTSSKRNASLGNVDVSNNIKTLNESVKLANDRALYAEQLLIKAKADADDKIFLLEKRVHVIEGTLTYRLTFDVMLGSDPLVNSVKIEHFEERRKKEMLVSDERRKKDNFK